MGGGEAHQGAVIGNIAATRSAWEPEIFTSASAQQSRPVARPRRVEGSISTTFGGVPRVCFGPSPKPTWTAAQGGTRTSIEAPG